ncbi:ATP-dependent DNA ligase [Streptomyces sp. NPDC047108]|uniref:ATP-dependent DNA ligase n=1 Tax=Streptomyces sp. NPDC047108 TaxID=3155025 RepID=UPI0033DEDD57
MSPAPRPPLRVALARSVDVLARGRYAYEPKFDGHRLVVFRTDRGVQLQARSGRIVTDSFPDLARAARELPPGTVLDGEVVVWTGGRTDFAAVQTRAMAGRTRAAALARELPASYAAFDLLGSGSADLRGRPYEERRSALVELLTPLGPPLQPVPVTTDPETATAWYESLREVGVEGLVMKRLDHPYRAGRRDWLKLRHNETRDAVVVGHTGPRTRPKNLVLVLPGDDAPVLSGRLPPNLQATLAEALAGLGPPDGAAGERRSTPDGATLYTPVGPGLTVEVLWTETRTPIITVLRLRGPE